MVQPTVNVPHGLPISAFTTTSASTARMITQISSTPYACDRAGNRPHLGANHVSQRPAVAPRRKEQHRHVLDRPGEYHARQNPHTPGR